MISPSESLGATAAGETATTAKQPLFCGRGGVGLLAVYEYLGIGNLGYSEEEIEETAEEVGETVEEEVDSFQG